MGRRSMSQKYSIINDTTSDNAIRIKTMWNGQNRYLWVLKEDLNNFLNNPDSFKVKSHLFETNEPWWSGGRKKFGGSGFKQMRWQRMVVKRNNSSLGFYVMLPIAIILFFLMMRK